jgi:hypothetical protein
MKLLLSVGGRLLEPHRPRTLWLNTVKLLAVGFERVVLIFMAGQRLT